jgi:hypothetical protein
MGKKILTHLVTPATFAVALAAPTVAQATKIQGGGAALAAGAVVKANSANFKVTLQNNHVAAGALECTGFQFEGKVLSNEVASPVVNMEKTTATGCTVKGFTADLTTNAAAAAPWPLEVQQPAADGTILTHLYGFGGGEIIAKVQMQAFGIDVATCEYASPSIQLTGHEAGADNDVLTVEAGEQFILKSRAGTSAAECGTVNMTRGDLTGTFQVETAAGAAVTVDMA